MLQSNYLEQRDKLIHYFTNDLNVRADEYLNGQFQMVSAGLINYLPDIAIERHETLFKQILLHKRLSALEQGDRNVLEYLEAEGFEGECANLLKTKPAIICTFHTGSYRLLNLFLCEHEIPFSLVVGKEVIEKEGDLFGTMYKNLPAHRSKAGFNIIDAEAQTAGLQMLRELKRGRSLVLYIDGNSGAGIETKKNENSCVVNFLDQQLYARKGIAFFAYAANVPIITVISCRKSWDNICLKFFAPINPDQDKPRDIFATEVTQKIYDLISPIITQYPEQWEGWLYIHKVAKIISVPVNEIKKENPKSEFQKIVFNSTRFGIFKVHGQAFLLKKHSYSFFEISTDLYDVLNNCFDEAIDKDCLDEEQQRILYQEGIINFI